MNKLGSYTKKLTPGIKSAIFSTLVVSPVILFFWNQSISKISEIDHNFLSAITLALILLIICLSSYTIILKIQSMKDIKFINKHYPDRKDREDYDKGWDESSD